jgi:hypothetical protein
MRIRVLIAALVAAAGTALLAVPAVPQSDLDAFMNRVLARRDENWKKLQQYILDERAEIALRGPTGIPVWGDKREYTWFIREGYFIRSPLKANGVEVSEADRRKAEDSYLRRVKEREKREAARERRRKGETEPATPVPDEPPTLDAFVAQNAQPEFVDSAYFMKFKFEQGRYALAGREPLEGGREVLRIEYYPSKLYANEDDPDRRKREEKKDSKSEKNRQYGATMERLMNKVALVTLWVEPTSQQIVKYVFDNVNFDFFPGAWLLRVDELKASMEMSQPFKDKDIWLPKTIDFGFSAMLAVGPIHGRYHVDYHDFREATTAGRIKKTGGQQ